MPKRPPPIYKGMSAPPGAIKEELRSSPFQLLVLVWAVVAYAIAKLGAEWWALAITLLLAYSLAKQCDAKEQP